MRLEPTGNPIDEKAGEVLGLLSGWTADAIGGRNLIKGTTTAPTERSLSETSYYWEMGAETKLEAGVEYTFSVIVDKISDDDTTVGIELGLGTGTNYRGDLPGVRLSPIPYGERVTLTFTPTEDRMSEGEREYLGWRIRNSQKAVTVAYRELKLERGPVATPWTPAPEDAAQTLLEGETPASPFPPQDPALMIRTDNSVGARVLAGDTMIYGDTGLRDIAESTRPGWLGTPHIQRLGDTVYLTYDTSGYLRPDPSADTTNHPFLRVPVGFRPRSGASHGLGTMNNGYSPSPVFVYGATDIMTTSRGTSMFGTLSWITADPWPTTLPGVPKT